MQTARTAKPALSFLLWCISNLAMICGIFVVREFYLVALATIGLTRWTIGAIDNFALVLLGLTTMALIIFVQDYYHRKDVRGFLLISALQLIVLSGLQFLKLLLLSIQVSGFLTVMDFVLFAAALLIAHILLRLRAKGA